MTTQSICFHACFWQFEFGLGLTVGLHLAHSIIPRVKEGINARAEGESLLTVSEKEFIRRSQKGDPSAPLVSKIYL